MSVYLHGKASLFKRMKSPASFEQTVLWEHTNLSGNLKTSNSEKMSALANRNSVLHSVSSQSSKSNFSNFQYGSNSLELFASYNKANSAASMAS